VKTNRQKDLGKGDVTWSKVVIIITNFFYFYVNNNITVISIYLPIGLSAWGFRKVAIWRSFTREI